MSMNEKMKLYEVMKLKTQQAKLQRCFGKVSRAGHCNLFSS